MEQIPYRITISHTSKTRVKYKRNKPPAWRIQILLYVYKGLDGGDGVLHCCVLYFFVIFRYSLYFVPIFLCSLYFSSSLFYIPFYVHISQCFIFFTHFSLLHVCKYPSTPFFMFSLNFVFCERFNKRGKGDIISKRM